MIFRFSQGLWQRHTLKNRGMNTGRRKKPKEESVRFWVTLKQWIFIFEPQGVWTASQGPKIDGHLKSAIHNTTYNRDSVYQ